MGKKKLVEVRKQTMPTEEHDCLDLLEYAMQYASALAAIKECMFRVEMQMNDLQYQMSGGFDPHFNSNCTPSPKWRSMDRIHKDT